MNFIFEIAVNALEAFLILEFLAQYFGFRFLPPVRYIGFFVFWAISTFSISFFSWNESFEIFSSLSQVALNIIFCISLLKGSIWPKVFISAFTMGGVILIASFSTFFIGHLHQYEVSNILTQFNSVRIIAIFTSKVLFFQATRIILRIKSNAKLSIQEFFPLVISLLISICMISILTHIAIAYLAVQQLIFYAVCLIIALNLLTYYLFIRLSRNNQFKHDYELLNLQHDCVMQNAIEVQHMYENIRSIRHDISNHLLCIANLLQNYSENNQQALDYIQNLLKQQEMSQKKIIFSGNDSLDAILNTKQGTAYQYGIYFDAVIADSLQFMAIEDICVLFGNLLNNAITASKQTVAKQINLKIQPQDTYVSIVVSNSITENVLASNPALNTTNPQKDGHGYGVKNIRKVVQKYQGLIRFYEDDEMFISDILLLTIPILE